MIVLFLYLNISTKPFISRCSRIFIIVVAIILLLGRNHFILGTGLIMFRWLIIPLVILTFIRAKKRETNQFIKKSIFTVLILLLSEFLFVQATKEYTSCDDCNTQIKVLTYNVFFKNRNPKTISDLIKREQPQIIALQELTPNIDQMLYQGLSSKYPYRFSYALNGTHGLAVYSKYPIKRKKLLQNDNKNRLPFAQLMELTIDSKKVSLINVHLSSPAIAVENPDRFFSLIENNYDQRENQYEKIVAYMETNTNQNYIMLGDFNTTPFEPLMRTILSSWSDTYSFLKSGVSFTFPNQVKIPLCMRLDYILIKGNLVTKKHRAIKKGYSDHLPVTATFMLK